MTSSRKQQPAISDQLRKATQVAAFGPGMSNRELARQAGVPEGAISRFLSGERGLNLETIDKLCRVLRVELRPIQPNK
jgi:transcriptional regulator with XRE-family HTH domain